ncbi:MAG: Asp-tRNA(Asn)/Glu-tRNA(Gln) amidotransferase subunit GatB [Bacteroidetes bacterium]|nr:Asp-tRNA(Asn)/Glu-tRNA(Gln) amidotransferase subunit GatB [Bacteroidota bacterium]
MELKYETIIGLEVHCQLLTKTKAFCSCPTTFGSLPNSNVCPICLGMPGVLPVLNKQIVDFTILMGLATNCTISNKSIFARKNYFYPDLPKGYQISQFENPICSKGFIEIELENNSTKIIGITRIHMEEDAGKSIHDLDIDTLVDVNRCGVPLIEIVSEPEMRSSKEAFKYLSAIKQIVTYLGICDGNMEEGSLRCDANVSVRKIGENNFRTKTEVKNMNSFRNVERALEFEIERQINLYEKGESVIHQTLLWDANKNVAIPMRSKEDAHDYRYFPDPDLVKVEVDEKWINEIKKTIPELPSKKLKRFITEFSLPKYDSEVLTTERDVAEYFEETIKNLNLKNPETFKLASNWIMTELLRVIKEEKVSIRLLKVLPINLAELIDAISNGKISGKIAKDIFAEMLLRGEKPDVIINKKGLIQLSDESEIEKIITKILDENPEVVVKFREGKKQLIGFFVGEVMKLTSGKANPKIVNQILLKKLNNAN